MYVQTFTYLSLFFQAILIELFMQELIFNAFHRETIRKTGRNGLLQNVLLVLTSFRTALICWLLFYILTENISLNSTRLTAGEFLRDFIGFVLECVCGRGGVVNFVCLFFSLAWMPWIIFTEALGSY